MSEFDFRYNTRAKLGIDDSVRMAIAVKQADGKRLTYREPVGLACQSRPQLE